MLFVSTLRTGSIRPHIVLPYSYADHEFAYRLAGQLRRDQVTRRIDEVDMSAGVFLVNRISQAARPVDFVVPAISSSSVMSDWVQHELRTALTRAFSGRHVTVLPARIDDAPLPGFLASQPCFDFHSGGWRRAYDDLLVTIQQRTSQRPAERPARGSRSPRTPRGRTSLLRRRWGF